MPLVEPVALRRSDNHTFAGESKRSWGSEGPRMKLPPAGTFRSALVRSPALERWGTSLQYTVTIQKDHAEDANCTYPAPLEQGEAANATASYTK